MKLKLTAISARHMFGRTLVMCVPQDEHGNRIGQEQPLASYLIEIKAQGHEIINAQEVLECVVSKYGFGA